MPPGRSGQLLPIVPLWAKQTITPSQDTASDRDLDSACGITQSRHNLEPRFGGALGQMLEEAP